ncbi:aspartate aminotransferase family protein [Salinisphaera sp. Q1T1-3]|uniref:pyridoxal phosphate-dependent decarboxylase family protein n=1 Tax=Salinisphaera sp. Q1T1-3 TaxID=2321229 RepID=UPI000E7245BB|nr:aspartate aminotransferase family protein [Salinisphaera sp. Q1T1-3]RJS94762.1 aspartate aminotransferase family protein [Salinisphaera sp. Q1T1-3]
MAYESAQYETAGTACRAAAPIVNRPGSATLAAQSHQAIDRVVAAIEGARRPCDGARPSDIAPRIAGVSLDGPAIGFDAALDELGPLYLDPAIYFHHPRYVAHLNCPVLTSAVAAEMIAAGINTSMDTWDQSTGATLIEQKLINWTARRAGLGVDADGIFTSGGTQSNLMAMLLAREQHAARRYGAGFIQRNGLPAEASRWRIFASEISHFSIAKAAAVLGLGERAVVSVAVDEQWRMDADALAGAVAEAEAAGEIPIAVVATFGTTDFGSLDDVAGAARVARRHGLWLHVDAAYGCGLLVSPTRGHEARVLAAADSITVDYHKAFFQPVACSALVVARGADLGHVTHHADYLNPAEAAAAGTPDQVNKSLQTTRRFDALKLWMSLRTVGAEAIGTLFDRGVALARTTYERMLAEPRFDLLHSPELGTIVFRFRPDLALSAGALDALNDEIRADLARRGEAMVAATRVHGRRYLKFTLLNAETTPAQMAEVLALIIHAGERRVAAQPGPQLSIVGGSEVATHE